MTDFLTALEAELTTAAERRTRRRWRPRVVAATMAVAVACAALAVAFAVPRQDDRPATLGPTDAPSIPPLAPIGAEPRIAVLNATTVEGLAGDIAATLPGSGEWPLVGNYDDLQVRRTRVFFARPDAFADALGVAERLGLGRNRMYPAALDEDLRRLAPGADVIVVVGRDRTR